MFIALVVLIAGAASATDDLTPPRPVTVAVPGFVAVGIDAKVAEAYSEHFATLLGRNGALKLTTQGDIARVIGLDRQKQLLGCGAAQGSCVADFAGALGVDAILSASLAKTGATYTATVRLIRASDGTELAAATGRLKSEDELQDWLDEEAPQLAAEVLNALGRPVVTHRPSPSPIRWAPAIGGAAVAVGGGLLFALSRSSENQLHTGSFVSAAAAHSVATTGRAYEGAGIGLMIAGGVAIAASAAWVFAVPMGEVQVTALPAPGGAAAFLGGTF